MSRIGELAETLIRRKLFEELIVDWQVDDIFSLPSGYYRSPDFDFSDVRWNIKYGAAVQSGNVNLWLCKARGPSIVVEVTFGIRGRDGLEMRKGTKHVFREGDSYCAFVPFCARSDLWNLGLLQDNRVIISCDLKINSGGRFTSGLGNSRNGSDRLQQSLVICGWSIAGCVSCYSPNTKVRRFQSQEDCRSHFKLSVGCQ